MFFLIDAFQNFSNLAIFQGVSLKWHSHNFAIYETLTGAQKCARSPINKPFGVRVRQPMYSHLLKRFGPFFRRNRAFENTL